MRPPVTATRTHPEDGSEEADDTLMVLCGSAAPFEPEAIVVEPATTPPQPKWSVIVDQGIVVHVAFGMMIEEKFVAWT